MEIFSKLLGDAVVIGMFLEGKCNRAQYEMCSEDADAELMLHGAGRVVWRSALYSHTIGCYIEIS